MKKILLTLFLLLVILREPISWHVFYLTADDSIDEKLMLPNGYYIKEHLSDSEMVFIKRLSITDNQIVFFKRAEFYHSRLVEKGIVFNNIDEGVYLLKANNGCVSNFFVDDFFALTVPNSCNEKIELSDLIIQLRRYYK